MAQDVALTARGLQLVNSSFFGTAKEVLAAKDTAQSLGTGLVRTLALTDGVFWCAEPAQLPGFDLEAFCRHGVATGLRASRIVALEKGAPAEIKTAFTAGVLHDVGKLVLVVTVPELVQQARSQAEASGVPLWQAEREVLDATHAEVGAYLLGLWGLPQAIVDIVARHHEPRARAAAGFGALTAVHVANALEHQSALPPGSPPSEGVDLEYLQTLRLERKLPLWARASSSG
jgi:putative nucleotidyltransferase with HDIG domain